MEQHMQIFKELEYIKATNQDAYLRSAILQIKYLNENLQEGDFDGKVYYNPLIEGCMFEVNALLPMLKPTSFSDVGAHLKTVNFVRSYWINTITRLTEILKASKYKKPQADNYFCIICSHFTDISIKDPDNFLNKYLLDALVINDVMPDDNWKILRTYQYGQLSKDEIPRTTAIIYPTYYKLTTDENGMPEFNYNDFILGGSITGAEMLDIKKTPNTPYNSAFINEKDDLCGDEDGYRWGLK